MNPHPTIESSRAQVSSETSHDVKTELGQFLTPYSTAIFMSSLFTNLKKSNLKLLDPGAGIGSLSTSFRFTSFNDENRK